MDLKLKERFWFFDFEQQIEYEISYWDKYETRFEVPLTLQRCSGTGSSIQCETCYLLIATCSTLTNISIRVYTYSPISPIYNRKPFDFLLKLIGQKFHNSSEGNFLFRGSDFDLANDLLKTETKMRPKEILTKSLFFGQQCATSRKVSFPQTSTVVIVHSVGRVGHPSSHFPWKPNPTICPEQVPLRWKQPCYPIPLSPPQFCGDESNRKRDPAEGQKTATSPCIGQDPFERRGDV